MKNAITKILSILIIAVLLSSFCTMFASAATASLVAGSSTANVGDKVSIKLTLNSGEKMQTVNGAVSYNAKILQFDSASVNGVSGGAGVLSILIAPNSKSYTVVMYFTAIDSGSSVVSTADLSYKNASGEICAVSNSSTTVNALNPTKSNNASLKSLRLGAGSLTPDFSSDVTEYTATIPYTATTCKVYVSAEDSGADISVEGSAEMSVGLNKRVVVVTAPSGDVKRYTIQITRQSENGEEATATSSEATPYDVVIDGDEFTVLADLTGIEIPIGFSIAQGKYAGNAVQTATDEKGEYVLYYLRNKETLTTYPYTYKKGIFTAVKYYNFNGQTYIFANEKATGKAETGYYRSNCKIGDFSVDCFASRLAKYNGFYWIYCYVDGEYDFYSYDSKQGIIQRDPNFELTSTASKSTSEKSFLERFKTINRNGQILIIAVAVTAVLIIALIILLIIRFFGAEIDEGGFAEDKQTDMDVFIIDSDDNEEKENPASEMDFSAPEDDVFVDGFEDDETDI